MTVTHGHYLAYNQGCRCDGCTSAWDVYTQRLHSRHRRGEVWTDTDWLRRTLRPLLTVGVRHGAIARAAGVSATGLRSALAGRTRMLHTARVRLEGLTLDDIDDRAVVDSRLAHDLLDRLDAAGVPRQRAAREALGWTGWPGGNYPQRLVLLGTVRALARYCDAVTGGPRCMDCAVGLDMGTRCARCVETRMRSAA